jgi:hypothetical protein
MSYPLSTYLHDHLSGAKAAIDLLEAMRDGHKDQALKDFAAYLVTEVQADRDTLQRLNEPSIPTSPAASIYAFAYSLP